MLFQILFLFLFICHHFVITFAFWLCFHWIFFIWSLSAFCVHLKLTSSTMTMITLVWEQFKRIFFLAQQGNKGYFTFSDEEKWPHIISNFDCFIFKRLTLWQSSMTSTRVTFSFSFFPLFHLFSPRLPSCVFNLVDFFFFFFFFFENCFLFVSTNSGIIQLVQTDKYWQICPSVKNNFYYMSKTNGVRANLFILGEWRVDAF